MAKLFISSQEQGVIVFRIWKTLPYSKRLLTSFALVLSGFAVQFFMTSFCPGCAPILIGNLLLIVKGYDNRVNSGKYDPDAGWEKVNRSKFSEVQKLHRNMKKWDRSFLDITNGLGFMTLVVISALIAIIYYNGFMRFNESMEIVAYDAILLLIPHWFTGIRSTLTKPNLILKISKIEKLLKTKRTNLDEDDIDYYMLLAGEDAKIPDDVKIRINIKNQDKDFLGLYGQIVINEVSGTAYPYFYVVLVAKRGFGLESIFQDFKTPPKITKEFNIEGDVEVLVIRQTTTKTSGYHTSDKQMAKILSVGIQLAESCAVKKR